MEKFYSFKTMSKMAGGGMHTQHTPHSPWIRPWLYNNKRWPQILKDMFKIRNTESSERHDCCKEVKGMLSGESDKTIFKC